MLCSLLLKKLAIPALGDDLHHVFLSCWPVESMSEVLPMIERYDECDPHIPLSMSRSSCMPSSLDMHFIIMPLEPHQNKISSMRWYCLDLRVIHSTSVLSSDGG
jgi:hypothetical protein